MSRIIFDLSEVMLAPTGRLRYYGIMRVAAEVGAELHLLDPSVRFAVFSYGHGSFFEVHPKVLPDGSVDLNVPSIKQYRLRSQFPQSNSFRTAVLGPIRAIIDYINRQTWDKQAKDLKPIDLNGHIFMSCSRPKLIVEQIAALKRQGTKTQLVCMLHDMIPLHDAARQGERFVTNFLNDNRLIMAAADVVVANSEFTRSEILHFVDNGTLPPAANVSAAPLVHAFSDDGEAVIVAPPQEPYLLTVGATLGRKNLEAVLEALLILSSKNKAVPLLVVAGAMRKRTADYLNRPRFDAIRDRVLFRINPPQSDLAALYKSALALVIASRMEGWGLPAGEALWFGTPAICSTAPVLKEVCGDLGLYFDPDKPQDLAKILSTLQQDDAFRTALCARIRDAHPNLRTWRHVAKDMLAATHVLVDRG